MTRIRKPKFTRIQIICLARLLHMEYTPKEIAEEIGVTEDTIYRCYIPAGCPHQRDKSGLIWINGGEFRAWAEGCILERREKAKRRLGEDEAWCFRCNRVVKIENPVFRKVNGAFTLLQGTCNLCGGKVNRGWKASSESNNLGGIQ